MILCKSGSPFRNGLLGYAHFEIALSHFEIGPDFKMGCNIYFKNIIPRVGNRIANSKRKFNKFGMNSTADKLFHTYMDIKFRDDHAYCFDVQAN